MKCIAFAATMSAVLMASTASLAQTPSWTVPPESARCPSKWANVQEFAFIMTPLKIRGATGSTVSPIAVR